MIYFSFVIHFNDTLSVKAELAHFKKHSPRWIYAINVVTGMWSITHFVKALPRILYEFIYIAHRSSISDFGKKSKAQNRGFKFGDGERYQTFPCPTWAILVSILNMHGMMKE